MVLTPEDVLRIAQDLLRAGRLNGRQFSSWHAHRYLCQTLRDAAAYIRDEEHYEISHMTVLHDSRYAHEIIVVACNEAAEGEVRFGHTLAAGADTWFSADTTAAGAARRLRAVPGRGGKKNNLSAQISLFSA